MVVYREELNEIVKTNLSEPKEEQQFYRRLREHCLKNIIKVMREDEVFDDLFVKIHYTGSLFDKLIVAGRKECDLNFILETPDAVRIKSVSRKQKNFMRFECLDNDDIFDNIIDEDDFLSPVEMNKVLQKSLNVALHRMKYKTSMDFNLPVALSKSIGNVYTLTLTPLKGRYRKPLDIDIVAAIEIQVDWLPWHLRNRIHKIERKSNVCEPRCLAVALPFLDESRLQVDFPQLARKMMAGKPSVKQTVRLLKYERDEPGSPAFYSALPSFSIKMAALHEVHKSSKNPDFWSLGQLAHRFFDIRGSVSRYLLEDELPDLFFPSINVLDRMKDARAKVKLGQHLRKTNSLPRSIHRSVTSF